MTTTSARSGSSAGSPAAIQADQAKQQIATVAMALFVERGYENVTVETVARAAGVSRRTVFRHFASKDELPFPDHAPRRARVQAFLDAPGRGSDPVRDVVEATELSLGDFLSTPELVLQRYALTREIPQLAEREVLEHHKYLAISRRHLTKHLPPTRRAFEPVAIAAFIDGMHRAALGDWVASGGSTDAMADLRAGTQWAEQALGAMSDETTSTLLLAVLPNTGRTRQLVHELADLQT